jgi:glycyl-tRNA synthetase beta chain
VPNETVSIAVGLADKIEILSDFWAIVEEPTGSKDPYALRRAALGAIRIILERSLRLRLSPLIKGGLQQLFLFKVDWEPSRNAVRITATVRGNEVAHQVVGVARDATEKKLEELRIEFEKSHLRSVTQRLLNFFADRLKVQLREQGARHDLVDAVFALEEQDDLLMIVRRVEALGEFLDSDDGKNLLAGTKRASNILSIEEKKDNKVYEGDPDVDLMSDIERHLWKTIQQTVVEARDQISKEDFVSAMETLSTLRSAVDSFFSKEANILVNHPDPAIRENRLKLLNQIRAATRAVADFSRIEG